MIFGFLSKIQWYSNSRTSEV